MNRDDIIRLAREAFGNKYPQMATDIEMYNEGSPAVDALDVIQAKRYLSIWVHAYTSGADAEREACAKHFDENNDMPYYGRHVAAAIRARGQND